MAKFMAPLCVAAWLVASLAVIACGNSPCSSGKSEETAAIEGIAATDISERGPNQWIQLARACANMLPEMTFWNFLNKIRLEAAVDIFDEFRLCLGHLNGWEPTDLGMPKSWETFLHLRDQTRECGEISVATILEQAKVARGNPWQFNYVLACHRDYLSNCGQEYVYKKAIGNIYRVDWDSAKYPTLDSYLRAEFWPLLTKDESFVQISELTRIVSFFERLSNLEIVFNEDTCQSSELLETMKFLVRHGKSSQPMMHKLARDYFTVYLVECGYEDRFTEVMKNYNVAIDSGKSAFANYLWGDFLKAVKKANSDHADEIHFALEISENLHYLDRLYRSYHPNAEVRVNCDEKTTEPFYRLLHGAKEKEYTKFVKCLDASFRKYLEACRDELEGMATKHENDRESPFRCIKKLAYYIELKIKNKFKHDSRTSRAIIEEILLESLDERHKWDWEDTCSENYGDYCRELWDQMGPAIEAMSYDFRPAINEGKIKNLINRLGYCSLNKLDFRIDKTQLDMFTKLGAPYYPTKARAPKLRPEECRLW